MGLFDLWKRLSTFLSPFLSTFLLLLQLFIRAKGAPTFLGFFTKYMIQKDSENDDIGLNFLIDSK
jgi:hypothetical protein